LAFDLVAAEINLVAFKKKFSGSNLFRGSQKFTRFKMSFSHFLFVFFLFTQ
jgi:hypothetical protein